ncbi:MipA/OmpV family protein [Erythrobacter insulae]|uniref:MipA/OmpV family protein n=1 Tax=Erythrobacter insulae TaxID=2584124 RepID=A0A547PCJ1_9SPHN|nr:MipA/OmpV family protein [Erythrobacter insulae]TRD11851.1 MipA/OmpV family protein [Erythrobacter insulae]
MKKSIAPAFVRSSHLPRGVIAFAGVIGLVCSAPAYADEGSENEGSPAEGEGQQDPQNAGTPPDSGGPPPGIMADSVFDDTWITVGMGAGLVPSYSGSDDYVFFPLPLIVGRVGGIGITPNGPGFNLNVLSQPPGDAPSQTSISFGPTFRFRNDRAGQIEDPVVELAGDLETAIEVGVQGGVSFPGVLNRFDQLTLSTAVRWDILGAHDGMLIEPGIGYFSPLGRGAAVQIIGSASFVDDSFADYYYTVTPAQSAATGLPEYTADGGLNSIGATAIATIDLDGNVLNGGLNVFMVGGYSRLMGDAANTPFTNQRGSADQFIGGIGLGYTF